MPRKRLTVRNILLGAYVVERLAYIDSVFLRTTEKIDELDLKRIKNTLIPDERFPWRRYFGRPREFVIKETGEIFYHYVHMIHQPTKDTFLLLQEIQDRHPGVLHLLDVHFALDLTTKTSQDADLLHKALLGVYTPRRLAMTERDEEVETSYFGRGRSGNEVAVYSDGKRKVRPKSPRVHLEWRIHGVKALRRANIDSAVDLAEVNHRDFWLKRLRLNIPPPLPRLVRILELRAARKGRPMSIETKEHTANVISRFTKDYNGRFSAQSLDSFLLSGLHPKPAQLYTRISNEWALPEPRNALWDEE